MATYTIVRKLDLLKHNGTAGGIPPVVLRRGDSGTEIQAEVTYGGAKFDLTGYSAMFCAVNADGGVIRREAVVDDADDGIVTYDATTDLTSVAGPVLVAYFELTSEDDEVATTDTLPFIILPNADLDGEAAQEYQVLIDELVAQVQESLGDIDAALDDAAAATAAANAAAAMASPYIDIGSAETLIGNDSVEASFIKRISGAPRDGVARIDAIKGNTIVPNQLNNNGSNTNTTGLTRTNNQDGSVTLDGTSTGGSIYLSKPTLVEGHKYLIIGCPPGGSASTYYIGINGARDDMGNGGILTAGGTGSAYFRMDVASGVQFNNVTFWPQLIDLTKMFSAGSEPTLDEFKASYPDPKFAYNINGTLLPVNIEGIETVGFNQWDEEWEVGKYNNENGTKSQVTTQIRCANKIPIQPSTDYYMHVPYSPTTYGFAIVLFYNDNSEYLSYIQIHSNGEQFTTPSDARYMTLYLSHLYGLTYKHDICINISDPLRNGEYEPYMMQQRAIDVETYFPNGLRGAGTAHDALYNDHAETAIGAVDLGSLNWNRGGDGNNRWITADLSSVIATPELSNTTPNMIAEKYAVIPKSVSLSNNHDAITIVNGALYAYADDSTPSPTGMLHYELATPTITPINPSLNMTYRARKGGMEAVLYDDSATAPQTAPPEMVIYYGYTAEGVRDEALSVVAAVENHKASTNYAVGSYLIHDGTLYKVTSAIASGEAITPGTNVTATTVMAELIALTS